MNIDTGEIFALSDEEAQLSIDELKEQLRKTTLNAEELTFIKELAEKQRPNVLHDLRSKNHSAKRRARKKIAKASQRRNRQ